MAKLKMQTSNTFTEAFDSFEMYNKSRNLADATLSYYDTAKKSLIAFMGNDFEVTEFNVETLAKYIEYLKGNGNNNTSVNSRLRGVKVIFRYFAENDYCKPIKIQMLKAVRKIKEIYTDEELKRLLKKPNIRICRFSEYRNWVIVSYLIGTGNRLSSIINIQIADVNLEENEVLLKHTKNKIQQLVPIAQTLRSILVEYLRYRKSSKDTDYLFCTEHGEKLSSSALISAITRYNQKRQVQKSSIHLFRHLFASKYIQNNGDIYRLSRLLGHRSLEITQHYINLYSKNLHVNYDEYNPLSSLMKNRHIKL